MNVPITCRSVSYLARSIWIVCARAVDTESLRTVNAPPPLPRTTIMGALREQVHGESSVIRAGRCDGDSPAAEIDMTDRSVEGVAVDSRGRLTVMNDELPPRSDR